MTKADRFLALRKVNSERLRRFACPATFIDQFDLKRLLPEAVGPPAVSPVNSGLDGCRQFVIVSGQRSCPA